MEHRPHNVLGGFGVHDAVEGDDAAEGGDGIASEGGGVGVGKGGSSGQTAGNGVLDDRDGGVVQVANGSPGRVGVEEVVEGHLLTAELLGVEDTQRWATDVKPAVGGAALLRVLPVADGLDESPGDAELFGPV